MHMKAKRYHIRLFCSELSVLKALLMCEWNKEATVSEMLLIPLNDNCQILAGLLKFLLLCSRAF